ncbi:flagellar biosynthetic protein FliR [Thermithiobacillus plumbiphilus]|uniref:Flagellar biosynthetic protein FliR n=1 Tax=Thermithiobacillus plumbiphilus TaxID=1729899 RepID=A0ABU9DCH3_9PROT
MISFTSAELAAWVGAYLFPFFRILALLSTAPVFGAPQITIRLRIGLAMVIAILLAPLLPPMPAVEALSVASALIIAQQILIGAAMGLVMRIVFAAVEYAAQVISLQMGLGFATLLDPQNGAQTPVIGHFFSLLATLAFLATNGHLLMIAALAESFQAFPILLGQGVDPQAWRMLVEWGGAIFRIGIILALPVMAVLLVTNIALVILSKDSPQLNIFVIGFPLLLGLGFWSLVVVLPYLTPVLTGGLGQGLRTIEAFLQVLS